MLIPFLTFPGLPAGPSALPAPSPSPLRYIPPNCPLLRKRTHGLRRPPHVVSRHQAVPQRLAARFSSEHEIYWEECGNPRGKPAVFVHGGPGAGAGESSRRFFDPRKYRVVLFDQRGCGRSKPHASLVDNTTPHLVADMEALRKHLAIERWLVFGGSWGSTLSLAYAQAHPKRVTELVLRGIFLLRDWEIHWFYQHGASAIFPDHWANYLAAIPTAERGDLVGAYYKRLTSRSHAVQLKAAKAWAEWEAATSYLLVNEQTSPLEFRRFRHRRRPHRMPLFRQPGVLRQRRPAAAGRTQDSATSRP